MTEVAPERAEMVFHSTVSMSEEVCERARGGLGSAFDRLGDLLQQQ